MKDLITQLVSMAMDQHGGRLPYMANRGDAWDPNKDWVYYSGPYWDTLEVEAAINSLLNGRWLSSGEKVARFEKHFGERFNQTYNVMVNSGSSANLVMLAALKKRYGWQDGDEIIVSACGFPTTIAPIVQKCVRCATAPKTADKMKTAQRTWAARPGRSDSCMPQF